MINIDLCNLILSLDVHLTTNDLTCMLCVFPGDFRCHDSHRCIPGNWHCDGHADCNDASDEPEAVCCKLK